jgi:hypothetical protein
MGSLLMDYKSISTNYDAGPDITTDAGLKKKDIAIKRGRRVPERSFAFN